MDTTRLSEKGQIVIPKRIRSAHGWESGLEFSIEEDGEGIKLIPVKLFDASSIEDVLGCIPCKGPRRSLKDMEAAIAKGAEERR